jgi:hypothetical protein
MRADQHPAHVAVPSAGETVSVDDGYNETLDLFGAGLLTAPLAATEWSSWSTCLGDLRSEWVLGQETLAQQSEPDQDAG